MSVLSLPASALLALGLYRPPLSWLIIALVVCVALAAWIAAMRRERTRWTAVLRLLALAGLVWVLMGHSNAEPSDTGDADLPRLRIFVDTSASMAQVDGPAPPNRDPITRLDAVRNNWLTPERLRAMGEVANVEVFAFDQFTYAASPDQLQPQGTETHLYQTIARSNADVTLILSDGHDTTGQSAGPRFADAISGRLYAVPVGDARSAPDLGIQAWADSDRIFEDQPTAITATLRQQGFDNTDAIVELVHNGEVVDQQTLTLRKPVTTLRYEIQPTLDPGVTTQAHHYSTRVRLAQGQEAYPDNNEQDLFVQVTRDKIRVLLIEGEPYWDTRSLARLIGAHPRFDLTALYGFGSSRRSRVLGESYDPAVDTDPAQQLERFDIVILGRHVQRMVDPAFGQRLDRYVRDGGALVFARGRPFDASSPLSQSMMSDTQAISPVQWGEPVLGAMRVRVGSGNDPRGPLAGLGDDAVLSRLPGMLAATQIDGRKTASLVMLEQTAGDGAPPMAALTTLRVGSGVTMALLTEGLWRWEMLPGVVDPDAQVQSVYGVFWIRSLQWLASGGVFLPGQDIAIEADTLSAQPGEAITFSISTRYIETQDLDLRLAVTDPQGNTRALTPTASRTPGTYTATLSPDQTGIYSLSLTTPGRDELIDPAQPMTTQVAVVDRSPERRDTSAKPERLRELVEPTGGQCLEIDEAQPLMDHLQTLQALRGREDRVDYDFNTWPAFIWIAGCFGLEWILRRRSGLR